MDLPFGMRCASASILKKLYPKAFAEMARIVRPQGRAVLMTTLRRQLFVEHFKVSVLEDCGSSRREHGWYCCDRAACGSNGLASHV